MAADAQKDSKRARITRDAWQAASKGVRKNVTPEEILSLFPADLVENPAASEHLNTVAREAYRLLESEFERAWTKWAEAGSYATFAARAAELDALEAVAESRLHAGQAPTHTYKKSADPDLSVAALTVPLLRDEIASMRARRQELEERTGSTVQSLLTTAEEADALEASLRERLATIAQLDEALTTAKWPEAAANAMVARSDAFA